MAITATDIKFYLSGGAANSNPNNSLGGIISSTAIATGSPNTLWDDTTAAESSAGDIEYRCIYVKNTHATLTYTGPNVVWISSQSASGHLLAIGLDPAAVSATATTVVNESTAPAGVSFTSPLSKGASGLSIPDLAPGQYKAIWLRRTVAGRKWCKQLYSSNSD